MSDDTAQKVYTISEGQLEYIEQSVSASLIEMYWMFPNKSPEDEEKLGELNQSILADLNGIRYLDE